MARPPLGLRDHEWAAPELGLDLWYCGQCLCPARIVPHPHFIQSSIRDGHRREPACAELPGNGVGSRSECAPR